MKITSIDRDACRVLRTTLDQALAPVAAQLGISLKAGHISYALDGKTANVKLEVATLSADGTAIDKDAECFKKNAEWLGMKPEDLGRKFKSSEGKEYTLTGYNPRAQKFPFLGRETRSGTVYKLTATMVKRGLGYEKPLFGNSSVAA